MNRFNVLDRQQNIHQNYLIEASAGTGKTFAIEHLVVRLLIEAGLAIEQILVVTFTRASTRDLKVRIRANIEKAITFLSHYTQEVSTIDYLLKVCEEGEGARLKARKQLEQALFSFDLAQIFTIHGFCSRMLRNYVLEGDLRVQSGTEEEPLRDQQLIQIIQDYLRTELREEAYSIEQRKIISEEYGHSAEKIEQAILQVIKRNVNIASLPNFTELLGQFQVAMKQLKTQAPRAEDFVADFISQAPAYEKLCDRQQQVKQEAIDKVTRFAALWGKEQWDAADFNLLISEGLFLLDALSPEKRKKNKTPPESRYPRFISLLHEALLPIVNAARHPLLLLVRMAHGAQQLIKKRLSEEETLNFDALLHTMQKRLEHPPFVAHVRAAYRVAIIDEFQDTDPIQWSIFRKLFIEDSGWGCLYLVGDPKQSIYAFRQADIYTYLEAADAIGESNRASLDTNYRSEKSLTDALNLLFSSAKDFLALPRLNCSLPYHPVKSGVTKATVLSDADQKGTLHFAIHQGNVQETIEEIEEKSIFPFIADEISKLIVCSQCAVLVSDRFQAERLKQFLGRKNIPTLSQRNQSLLDSATLQPLYELLQAVLHPRKESLLKMALGGRILGWTDQDLLHINPESMQRLLSQFYLLRQVWITQGLSLFMDKLLGSRFEKETVLERVLLQEGSEFYEELQQITQILIEEESRSHASPEKMVLFLEGLLHSPQYDEERFHRKQDTTQEAVQILTLHSSKGLEFDVVFALGLITQPKPPSQLVVCSEKGAVPYLIPVLNKESKAYIQHSQEIDAEKMRQLYVALTRAKQRLYVPVVEGREEPLERRAPISLFVEQLPEKELAKWVDTVSGQSSIRYTLLPCKHSEERVDKHQNQVTLISPKTPSIPSQKIVLRSFTALSKKEQTVSLPDVPYDYDFVEKTVHTLPSSRETGILLHHIFEKIAFCEAKHAKGPNDLASLIQPYIQNSRFEVWEKVICEIVFNALRVDLNGFCLADIPLTQCYRELEFLHPTHFAEEQGYLKGVIDLVFAHEGRYYIVDWKSNWLGKTSQDYSPDKVEEAMAANDYFLQAKIYTEALQRYLKVVDPRPFDQLFGGVLYLFLRGLDASKTYTQGIWSRFRP